MAIIGAVAIQFPDPQNFPSVGLAIWWALQTVTTVGYGDIVPTTTAEKVSPSSQPGVTSAVIERSHDRAHVEETAKTIIDSLAETKQMLTDLGQRLDRIEAKSR